MSKGGAQRKTKQDEVMARIEEAAERKLLDDALAEQKAEMERQQRIHEVWWRCRHKVLTSMGGFYSLPGEVLGAEIAEAMLRQIYTEMLRKAQEQREIRPGDIRLASPVR